MSDFGFFAFLMLNVAVILKYVTGINARVLLKQIPSRTKSVPEIPSYTRVLMMPKIK